MASLKLQVLGSFLLLHICHMTKRSTGMTSVRADEKEKCWILTLQANLANWYAMKAPRTWGYSIMESHFGVHLTIILPPSGPINLHMVTP